jgi:hypothetical protein
METDPTILIALVSAAIIAATIVAIVFAPMIYICVFGGGTPKDNLMELIRTLLSPWNAA